MANREALRELQSRLATRLQAARTEGVQASWLAVEAAGGEIVGCFVMADRSGGTALLASPGTGRRYPVQGLWQLEIPTFEPGSLTCPRCADETPLHAPGSTGTSPAPEA